MGFWMEKKQRTQPAQERWINELSDEDIKKRVKVLGAIIESNSEANYVILDDGTGMVHIQNDKPIPFKLGDHIRVFGIMREPQGSTNIIDAEIIQDMRKLDRELYKRVQDVKRRFKQKES